MTAPDVLFVTVCGIGTVNSLFLAAYLLRTGRGDRLLNRLFAALILTFSFRVGKCVAILAPGTSMKDDVVNGGEARACPWTRCSWATGFGSGPARRCR